MHFRPLTLMTRRVVSLIAARRAFNANCAAPRAFPHPVGMHRTTPSSLTENEEATVAYRKHVAGQNPSEISSFVGSSFSAFFSGFLRTVLRSSNICDDTICSRFERRFVSTFVCGIPMDPNETRTKLGIEFRYCIARARARSQIEITRTPKCRRRRLFSGFIRTRSRSRITISAMPELLKPDGNQRGESAIRSIKMRR